MYYMYEQNTWSFLKSGCQFCWELLQADHLRPLLHDIYIGFLTCWITRQGRFNQVQKTVQGIAKLAKHAVVIFCQHVSLVSQTAPCLSALCIPGHQPCCTAGIFWGSSLVRASFPFPRSTVDPGNSFIKSTMPLSGQNAPGILALQVPCTIFALPLSYRNSSNSMYPCLAGLGK